MTAFGWSAFAKMAGSLLPNARRGASSEALPGFRALPPGAQVVDVRSPREYRAGHVKSSLNIPLAHLTTRASELDASRPVVLCCASGARSAAARSLLLHMGFREVYDAGAWTNLAS